MHSGMLALQWIRFISREAGAHGHAQNIDTHVDMGHMHDIYSFVYYLSS